MKKIPSFINSFFNSSSRLFSTNSNISKIYVFGGRHVHHRELRHLKTAYCLDLNKRKWRELPPMPYKVGFSTSCVLNNKIFIIGGGSDEEDKHRYVVPVASTRVSFFDPLIEEWFEGPPNLEIHVNHSASVCDRKIYIFGGQQLVYRVEQNPHKLLGLVSAEVFDPNTNNWEYLPSMPFPRLAHSSCVADGKIFLLGGKTAQSSCALNSATIYDPTTNTYSSAPRFGTSRAYCSSVSLNNRIYVLGGQINPSSELNENEKPQFVGTNIVEYLDLSSDQWLQTSPMNIGRALFAAVAANSKIFCIGGVNIDFEYAKKIACNERPSRFQNVDDFDNYSPYSDTNQLNTLNSVEVYDPSTDQWENYPPLPIKAFGLMAVAL